MFLEELNELFRENWSKFLTAGYLDFWKHFPAAGYLDTSWWQLFVYVLESTHNINARRSNIVAGILLNWRTWPRFSYLWTNKFSHKALDSVFLHCCHIFLPRLRSTRDTGQLICIRLHAEIHATSFPGSLFSASLSRWNRDPGCGWSRDWSRDQPQPGSLFQRLREAEKRDPGNEVETYVDTAAAIYIYIRREYIKTRQYKTRSIDRFGHIFL